MKSNFLKVNFKKVFIVVFLVSILSPLIFVLGCSGGGGKGDSSPPTPTPPSTSSNRKIFVANVLGNRISVFDANANGNATPIRSIGAKTELFSPFGIFVDTGNNEIFITNFENDTVTVYRSKDDGDVSPIRTIGGPNTGLLGPEDIFVDTESNEIFVNNFSNATITVYERTDDGDVSPIRIIGGPNTGLLAPDGIYVDIENDEIFVGNRSATLNGILVFRRTDEGDVPPLRVIKISELTDEGVPFAPVSIYVDTVNDEIFVGLLALFSPIVPPPSNIEPVFENRINVYRETDEGNASPLRKIGGTNTELNGIEAIFVDTVNNEIFAANLLNNTVTVYGRPDTGNIHPLRTLSIFDSNSAGFLLDDRMPSGVYIDVDNDELFVSNLNNTITVYRRTDEGDTPPLRIIGGNTGLLNPKWIFVDTENNEIFTSNFSSRLITSYGLTDKGNVAPLRTIYQGGANQSGIFLDKENNEIFVNIFSVPFAITVLRRTDEGNVTPLRTIGGINTRLFETEGLFIDTKNNEIFVTDGDDPVIPGEITVYGRKDSGNVPPLRIISGENTGLSRPLGIFVDTENDEIFVTNPFDNTITIYGRTDKGNVHPKRTIAGFNTRLFRPAGIFLDTENDEIFVANADGNRITVYRRTDEGNVFPKRTIVGPNTGLALPWGIFVADSP